MTSTASGPCTGVPAVASVEAPFDHERFDVYQFALEFQQLVPGLLPRRGFAALRDQLDRASSSILPAPTAHRHARGLLLRVTQMLTKLLLRMQR